MNLDSYTFNGSAVVDSTAKYLRVSSFPFIYFPTVDAAAILASYLLLLSPQQTSCMLDPSIENCGATGMTCSNYYSVSPSVVFTIDGEQYTLPAQAYLLDYLYDYYDYSSN